jgi:hypothetical protein
VEEGYLLQDDMGFTEEEGKPPAILGTPMYQYGSDGDEYLEESDVEFGDGGGYEEDSSSEQDSTTDCNKSIKEDFQKYIEHASKLFGLFSSLEVNAISLLHMLRQTSAPLLGMYEAVMGWHLDVLKRQQVGTKPMVNRNTLLKKLKKRYNMAHNTNIIYNITVPNSCANAKIVTNSAKWCVQSSLLTDPSIKDSDYLFHNDNPLSEPPGDLEYVCDINTGAAYLESYKNT